MVRLRWLFWGSALLLWGCSPLPLVEESTAPVWEQRVARLAPLRQWQLRGRIALRQGERGWHSGFEWQRTATNQRFVLHGVLGAGRLELLEEDGESRLITAGKVHVGSDAATLLQEVTAMTWPLQSIPYWVRGLPDPGLPSAELLLDGEHRLQSVEQVGWRVTVVRYQQVDRLQGVWLPALIRVEGAGLQLKVKIEHEQWL